MVELYLQLKKKNNFVFVTYTIIQSITSSEMYSLHLTHPSAHTHLEQWAANVAAPGEQLGVRCLAVYAKAQESHLSLDLTLALTSPHLSLAQGFHLSRGQFLPEPRFEPTTSGYKSNIRVYAGYFTEDYFLNLGVACQLCLKCALIPALQGQSGTSDSQPVSVFSYLNNFPPTIQT